MRKQRFHPHTEKEWSQIAEAWAAQPLKWRVEARLLYHAEFGHNDRRTLIIWLRAHAEGVLPERLRIRRIHYGVFRSDEMKRRSAAQPGETPSAGVDDEKFSKAHPSLWEYMTKLKFDDGTDRELSKLSIFVENGMVKAALNDTEERASCYVTSDSVGSVLKVLEKALADNTAEWRSWQKGNKKK